MVEDENDCVPLTIESSYTGYVPENSHGGITVLQIKAEDADRSRSSLTYKIVSGNPGGLFQINPKTGMLSIDYRYTINQMYRLFLFDFKMFRSDNDYGTKIG